MDKLSLAVFFLLLSLALITEGLALPFGNEFSFLVIISIPFLSFVFINKQKEILIPKTLSILFLFFFAFTIVSVIFSSNVYKSTEYLVSYLTCFLLLIYSYNYKGEIKKRLPYLVLASTIIFCLYSVLIYLRIGVPLEHTGLQFVFSNFSSHNHLGDFLLLPFIILLFAFLKANRKIMIGIAMLSLVPFFVFSYSRSAYLDAIIICIIFTASVIKIKNSVITKISLVFFTSVLIVISSILFLTVAHGIEYKAVRQIRSELTKHYSLNDKEFFANRDSYTNYAISTIINQPLFGVGPGNFLYSSIKYGTLNTLSSNAHNIFLDIFSENGILAGTIFIVIVLLVFGKIKNNIFGLMALALLLNFQTDYTYRIFVFLVLFFVLIGLIYEEKNTFKSKKTILFTSGLLLLFGLVVVINNVYYYLYPASFKSCQPINSGLYKVVLTNFTPLEMFLLKGDPDLLKCAAQKSEEENNYREVLKFYELAYFANPYLKAVEAERIYELKLKYEGKEKATEFVENYLERFSNHRELIDDRINSMKLCQKAYEYRCPYSF